MHWLGMSAGVDADYELVLPRWYLGRHSSRFHFGSIACMSRPSLLHDKSSSCCNWLFRMSRFLQRGLDFRERNKQGHTPLHKAAFSGHERFCRWLVETVGLLDSQPDESGNYAADLAEMGELSERYLSVSPACPHCHTV